MKSKSNRVFQNNVRKNISDNHMLQKDYAKSIGITTRQLAH
ncbi:transcriptional regulator, partial [Lacticaseibacillus rhamnosus]